MESEDSEKEDILLLQIGVLMTLNKKIKSKKTKLLSPSNLS